MPDPVQERRYQVERNLDIPLTWRTVQGERNEYGEYVETTTDVAIWGNRVTAGQVLDLEDGGFRVSADLAFLVRAGEGYKVDDHILEAAEAGETPRSWTITAIETIGRRRYLLLSVEASS